MVSLACNLLNLQPGERVLDLFCGLGNFSLPLARCVGETGQVIAVEEVKTWLNAVLKMPVAINY